MGGAEKQYPTRFLSSRLPRHPYWRQQDFPKRSRFVFRNHRFHIKVEGQREKRKEETITKYSWENNTLSLFLFFLFLSPTLLHSLILSTLSFLSPTLFLSFLFLSFSCYSFSPSPLPSFPLSPVEKKIRIKCWMTPVMSKVSVKDSWEFSSARWVSFLISFSLPGE